MAHSVTAAICTYNRAQALERCIRSLYDQGGRTDFEVLVVDNASSDNTRYVVENLQREFDNLRYVIEPKQGLSHARNTALRETLSEIVAYVDDDGVVQYGWLAALADAMKDESVGCAGGRITLEYVVPRPEWLTDRWEFRLSAFDLGPETRETEYVFGCNFAVRRSVALEIGGFSTQLGYSGTELLPGEETELCKRMRQAGYRVVYVPTAHVVHIVDPVRLSKEWFVKRARLEGKATAMIESDSLAANEIAEEAAWLKVYRAAHWVRRDSYQVFVCSMRLAHRQGMLEVMLPGWSGRLRRSCLFLRLAPKTIRWVASIARCFAFGRPLPQA